MRREWFESPGWESDHYCAMTIPLFFCLKSLSSLAREIRPCHCVCGIYLICIIMETLFYSWQKVTNDVGYLNITFLHAERGRIQRKCSWCRLNSFPFYHLGREEIMWNVFNFLHALSWFKITQGCVSYILILVNSLILLFPCDQSIYWASQLIVQIVPPILWLCALGQELFYSVFLCVQSRSKLQKWILMKLFIVLHILTVPIGTKLLCWIHNWVSCVTCAVRHLAPDYASGALLCDNSNFSWKEIRNLFKGFTWKVRVGENLLIFEPLGEYFLCHVYHQLL